MTKVVKVLGTGCKKCQKTEAVVKKVILTNHLDATVEKTEDITEIMKYDVITTPAVVVDEEVKIKGKVPTEKEILKVLQE